MLRVRRLFVGLSIAIALAGIGSAQTIQVSRDNKTIAITASDEATATADIAAVAVGFEIFGPDSTSAYTDGGKTSHAVLDALHKVGIEDKSIQSTGQSLQRNTEFNDKDTPEQRAKKQFVFRQFWEVSVPPRAAAEVIRVAVAAGANQTGAIDWRLSDRKALQAKAAAAALVKARDVASQMAEGLHVKLGDLIYASNETPRVPIQPMLFKRMGAAEPAPPGLPPPLPTLEIRPQTIREEATVYAVFAIE